MKYRVEFLRHNGSPVWQTFKTFVFDDRPTADKWVGIVRKARDCEDARVVEIPDSERVEL